MGLFSKPSLVALLDREQSRLDDAFGVGAYRVGSSHPDEATVQTSLVEVRFGRDRRDGAIGSMIVLRDPPAETGGEAEVWTWARFLGVEVAPVNRDRAGRVRVAPDEQLRAEITMIGRLMKEVFSDPQRLRDAAFFVEGYTVRYNDGFSDN